MAGDRATRRLAAILSADVVGYSRLMEADEAGTLAALKRHRVELIDPKIAQFGGRIVNTGGDSLLSEFPSVVDALQCAVEIQSAMPPRNADLPEMRRMQFRIGINLGAVIVESDDIFGDGVNVAARLEALSAPGGVCVSGSVHEHTASRLPYEFVDLGEQTVKNIARPIRAWHVQPGGTRDAGSDAASFALPLPGKPSIAVLPFTNMSGDPEGVVLFIIVFVLSFFPFGCSSILWLIMFYWAYTAYRGDYTKIPAVTDFIKKQGWV